LDAKLVIKKQLLTLIMVKNENKTQKRYVYLIYTSEKNKQKGLPQ